MTTVTISFSVNGQYIRSLTQPIPISNTSNCMSALFVFSADWVGVSKTVTFRSSYMTYSAEIIDNNCVINDIDPGIYYVSVRGVLGDSVFQTSECIQIFQKSGAYKHKNGMPDLTSIIQKYNKLVDEIKIINNALETLSKNFAGITIPTKVSQLINDNLYLKDIDIINKVDKISGKVLSTNDYTTADKEKLSSITKITPVISISASSTDTDIPSAKATHQALQNIKINALVGSEW